MSRLRQDRQSADESTHAWELTTGKSLRPEAIADDDAEPPPASLIEVLEHGREGEPRWIVADSARGARSQALVRRVADAARSRGYVPVAADAYVRVRGVLDAELAGRTLMVIVPPAGSIAMGRAALVDAAAKWPRPHVLLTFAPPQPALVSGGAGLVREARAVYAARSPRPPALTAALPEDVLRHVRRGSRAAEFMSTGRHAAAERLLRDVAGALIRRQAPAPAAQALVSLGRLLLERGRAADADRVFGEAADHAHAADDEPLSLSARVWQAAARTDAAQLTAAESVCRAALLAGMLGQADRRRAEATLARILLWQGRVDEAARCHPACEDGEDGDPETAAYVTSITVRTLLAVGDVFSAGQKTRELLDWLGDGDDRSERGLARVIGISAHLRVLLATGDLAAVEERMQHLQRAVQSARTPLRLARMRLLLLDAYRRAGRTADAEREAAYLRRVQPAAPPLLRDAIESRTKNGAAVSTTVPARAPERNLAAAMVRIVQERDDDRAAMATLLPCVVEALQASRVEVCSADAGPATVIMSSGPGVATEIGPRVLRAGIVIGPEAGAAGRELGVPVRIGSRLVGALCARWPIDRALPLEAAATLDLAAAVLAPRMESMLCAARMAAAASTSIPELVGSSEAIADVRRAVVRAAAAPFAVLIEGESGVGKELVARAIHSLSPRRERRFCDLNCAALPDELFESELFGHARGAFTGAVTERAGMIEEADGGTLLLDEVADLSPRAQAKLLRVIQQQEVRRVGESFSRKVDVRIVSAANRDMRAEAAAGRFRQDLLYRLDVIRIRVPPLRERPEDIPALAQHFWTAAASRVGTRAVLAHSTITALSRYSWPGNVRELQNVMSALAVAAPVRGQVRPSLLPQLISSTPPAASLTLADARAQFERRFIEMALARAAGKRARAARELGLSRQGLLKLMARLGLSG